MTKFVTAVIVTAFTVVFSASAMAEGWKIGNWEPPKKEQSPVLKEVSLGIFQEPAAIISVQARSNCVGVVAVNCAGVARASCVGAVQVQCVQMACSQQVGCAGRSGGWFFGRRMQRNRQARANARMGCN